MLQPPTPPTATQPRSLEVNEGAEPLALHIRMDKWRIFICRTLCFIAHDRSDDLFLFRGLVLKPASRKTHKLRRVNYCFGEFICFAGRLVLHQFLKPKHMERNKLFETFVSSARFSF